jgi:phage head maturation protease
MGAGPGRAGGGQEAHKPVAALLRADPTSSPAFFTAAIARRRNCALAREQRAPAYYQEWNERLRALQE